MFKQYIIIVIVLGIVIPLSAQTFLERENYFLDIPKLESISDQWFASHLDSVNRKIDYPVDMKLIKLTPYDYRVVILDAWSPHFREFRLDQYHSLDKVSTIEISGTPPDTCKYAISMCLMQSGAYFDPQTDSIAVLYQYGAAIGIYSLDPRSGTLQLNRVVRNAEVTKPVGIFFAFNDFFISDEEKQAIFRINQNGVLKSSYSRSGNEWQDRYLWISNISGYVDISGIAHMYVSDGTIGRMDHLTATANDPEIYKFSSVLRTSADTTGFHLHEAEFIPNLGVMGFDRYKPPRFYLWSSLGSLGTATRTQQDWNYPTDARPIHIWQVGGRLAVSTLDTTYDGWALHSFTIDGSTVDDPLPYPNNHWTIDISPIYVNDSLHIPTGTNLVIDAGVQVYFNQDAALVVDSGAILTVNGTEQSSVVFDAKDQGETWNGVYVYRGRLAMNWTNMFNFSDHAVNTNTPAGSIIPVNIDHCTFDGSRVQPSGAVLMLWNSPALKQKVMNSSVQNTPSGGGMYLYNCKVDFSDVTIDGCGYINSYIKKVTGSFTSCTFRGRTSLYGLLTNQATCTPRFMCCSFENLAPFAGTYNGSIYCMSGTMPYFGGAGYDYGVSNVINDSSRYLLSMSGPSSTLPVIANSRPQASAGRNDWYQRSASGKFINWANPSGPVYLAIDQYWMPEADTSLFTPNDMFDWAPNLLWPWGLCGGADPGQSSSKSGSIKIARSGTTLDDNQPEELFSRAMDLENSENYAQAQAVFRSVVASSENLRLRWQAITHIVTTDVYLGNQSSWIPNLIDSLINIEYSSYGSRIYGKRLLANYYLNRADYDQAIGLCDSLLQSGLTFTDSICVVTELLGIQMTAGVINSDGGLDAAAQSGIPQSLRVTSQAQGLKLERDILTLLGTYGNNHVDPVVIPSKYTLYQNYPNPFNPNTEIKFDLPENTRVELAIFNTLGQKVTTLVDEVRTAGAYTVVWDSKNAGGINVASGVYIYRIKAGNFVQSRKMALIR